MRHTRTWLYVFLPFLYLALVLGFIGIQFSKKSDSFSQSLGDLTVSGKTSSGGQPAELALRGRGLEFVFDSSHSLLAELADGTVARLRPLSWAWHNGDVVVSFQDGVQLAFEKASATGRSLLIHPVANAAVARYSAFHIPFGPQGGGRLVRGNRNSFVVVERDKNRLLASVDGALDRIDTDNTFVLRAGKDGFRPARLDPMATGISADLSWETLDGGDPADAEAALGKYWDRAYASWASADAFSTTLAAAWAHEALARGEYPAAFTKIQNLLSRDRQAWGFGAVAFLGNVVELTAQQRKIIETLSSRSQPDWAGQGRLWLDARHYGPPGSADRVKELLLGGKLPDDVPGLLAIFENLRAIQASQPADPVSARVAEVVALLETKVIRREGELFVPTADGLLDLRSTLVLGRLWIDYSKTLSNETYGAAGARLVTSALARQDASGKISEFLVSQDGRIVRSEGTVRPEEVYAVVRPVEVAEADLPALGPGAFVRSPSAPLAQNISETQARFTFRFPVGSAEHIIISGVPAFDHITMHGIRWRTDPQFQSYTDGWAYSASTKTLFVKIKHREEQEDLVINFRSEQ